MIFLPFFFCGCICGVWNFPGQARDQTRATAATQEGSLTCCTTRQLLVCLSRSSCPHFIERKTEAPQPQIFACGAWRASGKAEVSNLGILGLRFAPSASHVHIQEQCEARAMPSLVLSRMRQSRACPRIVQAGDRRLAEPDSILVPTGDGLFDLSQVA